MQGGYVGTPEQFYADIGSVSDIGSPAIYNEDGDLVEPASGLYAKIDAVLRSGASTDQALGEISDLLGSPAVIDEATGEVTTPASGIYSFINDLDVVSASTLQNEINGLQNYINQQDFATTTQLTGVQQDIDEIAQIVGKPAERVTQSDIDYVQSLLDLYGTVDVDTTAGDVALDRGAGQLTALDYDVNKDGRVDLLDQALLNELQGDPDALFNVFGTGISPDSVFADTGQFATMAQQREADRIALEEERARNKAALDAQTAFNLNLQAQINAEAAARKAAAEQARYDDVMRYITGANTGRVTVPDDPKKGIDIYDFSTIFRTPEDAAFYGSASPYFSPYATQEKKAAAKGGLINTDDDELYKLVLGD